MMVKKEELISRGLKLGFNEEGMKLQDVKVLEKQIKKAELFLGGKKDAE